MPSSDPFNPSKSSPEAWQSKALINPSPLPPNPPTLLPAGLKIRSWSAPSQSRENARKIQNKLLRN